MTDKDNLTDQLKMAMYLRQLDENALATSAIEAELDPTTLKELDPSEIENFKKAQRCLIFLHALEKETTGQDSHPQTHNFDQTTRSDIEPNSVDEVEHFPGKIGRFEIQRELGRGGFGIVLLARDPNLDRLVALKIPKLQSLISSDAAMRFQREAKSAAILSHPAIVPIYESGKAGLIHYIAFAYCPGLSMRQWLAKQNQSLGCRLAARIVAQLADAVQHAHSRGVVHRDLKPGNILLLPTDEHDAVQHDVSGSKQSDVFCQGEKTIVDSLRITDFGLAKITSHDEPDTTHSRALIGTPSYMSPEQARGDNASIGTASDIYSLGVILFELMTGRPPLTGANEVAILHAIINLPPPYPRRLNPDVPHDLAAICLKCLEKSPEARYSTALDLADELNRFLDGKPVRARRVNVMVRFSRWCRRNPVIAGVLSFAMTAIVGCTILVTWQWMISQENLRRSLAETQRAQKNVGRVELAIKQMVASLSDRMHFVPQMQTFRTSLLQQAVELQQQLIQDSELDDPRQRIGSVRIQLEIANLQETLGDFNAAEQTLLDAEKRIAAVVSVDAEHSEIHEIRAKILQLQGKIAMQKKDFDEAARLTQQSVLEYAKIQETNDMSGLLVKRAAAEHLLGQILDHDGKTDQAETTLLRCLEILERIKPSDRDQPPVLSQFASTYNSLAVVSKSRGQYEKAEEYYCRARDFAKSLVEKNPDHVSHYVHQLVLNINLGNLYLTQRKFKEAAAEYDQAVEHADELVDDYPGVPEFLNYQFSSYVGLGISRLNLHDYSAAEEALNQSLRSSVTLENITTEKTDVMMQFGKAYTNLSKVYKSQNRLDDAQSAIDRAVEMKTRLTVMHPQSHACQYDLAVSLTNLGKLYEKNQAFESALVTYENGIEHATKAQDLQPSNPQYQRIKFWFERETISTLCKLGRYSESLEKAKDIVDSNTRDSKTVILAVAELAECVEGLTQEMNTEPWPDHQPIIDQYVELAESSLRRAAEFDPGTIAEFRDSEIYDVISR